MSTTTPSEGRPPRLWGKLAAYVALALVAALLVFMVWWLSMADASMSGCGGG